MTPQRPLTNTELLDQIKTVVSQVTPVPTPKESVYQLPCSVKAKRSEFFDGSNDKVTLTPEDIAKMYGIAKGTIYNEIGNASTDPDPIPFIKLGEARKSKILIPRRLFEERLLRKGNAWKVS
jgi:hypothetical protein